MVRFIPGPSSWAEFDAEIDFTFYASCCHSQLGRSNKAFCSSMFFGVDYDHFSSFVLKMCGSWIIAVVS